MVWFVLFGHLFRKMGGRLGVNVRSIVCSGISHSFQSEVYDPCLS